MEIYCHRIPPQALQVQPPYPLPPLQRLTEALVELLMYQAKEGGGKDELLAGLRPQPRADPGCLLQEKEHLIRDRGDPVISQGKHSKDVPSLELERCLVPS